MRQAVRELMRDIDLILTPTSPIVAPRIEDSIANLPGTGPTVLGRHTSPFNLTGQPTISLPCGFASNGLPIGLQLSGRNWEEGTVLRAAYAYEQATEWHERRPALYELFAQPVFLIRHVWVCFEKGYQGSDNASEGPRI